MDHVWRDYVCAFFSFSPSSSSLGPRPEVPRAGPAEDVRNTGSLEMPPPWAPARVSRALTHTAPACHVCCAGILVHGLGAVEELLELVLGEFGKLVMELVMLGRRLLLELGWRGRRRVLVLGRVLELRAVWFESLVHTIPEVVIF